MCFIFIVAEIEKKLVKQKFVEQFETFKEQ